MDSRRSWLRSFVTPLRFTCVHSCTASLLPTLAKAPDQPTPFASLYERRSHFLSLSTLRTPFSFDGRGLFKLRRRRVTWPRLWTNNLTTFPSAIDEKQSTDKQMSNNRKRSHTKQLLLTSSGLRPEPPTLRGFPPNPRLVFTVGVASAPPTVFTPPSPLMGAFPYGAPPPSPRLFVRTLNVILAWVIVFFVVVPALPPFLNQVVKQPAFIRYAAEYLGHVIVTTESHHLLCAHSALDVLFPRPLLFFFLFHTIFFLLLLIFCLSNLYENNTRFVVACNSSTWLKIVV